MKKFDPIIYVFHSPASLAAKLSYWPYGTSTSQNKKIWNKPDYQNCCLDLNISIIKSETVSLKDFQVYNSQSLFAV